MHTVNLFPSLWSFMGILLMCALNTNSSLSQTTDIPGLIDVNKLRFEIVDATYVTELSGNNATYKETELEKYRGIVITVRITKPANANLTLHAQDLPLHYRRDGDEYDVAKCSGLSGFSTSQDVDRSMNFYRAGLGKVTTGTATQKASTVYIDMFYQYMEPDTRALNILVAQPVGAFATSKGWKK